MPAVAPSSSKKRHGPNSTQETSQSPPKRIGCQWTDEFRCPTNHADVQRMLPNPHALYILQFHVPAALLKVRDLPVPIRAPSITPRAQSRRQDKEEALQPYQQSNYGRPYRTVPLLTVRAKQQFCGYGGQLSSPSKKNMEHFPRGKSGGECS